jgi:hypothetical protein
MRVCVQLASVCPELLEDLRAKGLRSALARLQRDFDR